MTPRWTWLVCSVLVLTSCALDYGKDTVVSADQVPQMVFEGIKQTAMKDGQVLYTMESQTSEVYQAKKEVRLKNFRFQEYDSDGKPASQGSADAAVVNTDSNDARISGRLTARSEEQQVTLQIDGGNAGGLTWTNEDRILKTEPNTGVILRKDDGSQIEARTLTLDMGSNHVELEEGVSGTWTSETNRDANPPAPPSGTPDPVSHP